MRERVFIYGNCQGWWLAQKLLRDASLTARFEFIYQASFGDTPADHPALARDFFDTCKVVIWQTAANAKPPEFIAHLRSDCRQIRYPTLWLKALWPLHCSDPRNQAEPGFPAGPWPYGDRLLLKLMDEGHRGDELFHRYLDYDVSKMINLDRFAEIGLAELRHNDRHSDFSVTSYIESLFSQHPLFSTLNHPNEGLLCILLRGIAGSLCSGEPSIEIPFIPEENRPFGEIQIPIHPRVAEHFRLKWARPDLRTRYNSKFVTIKEWIASYETAERIPICTPPQLWIQQAEQAKRFGDFEAAKRFLLDAAALHPELFQYLKFLGLMLAERGEWTEAEKVLRYANAQHPKEESLYVDLARLMLVNHHREEALRILDQGRQLAASNREITRLLESILAKARAELRTSVLQRKAS